MYPIDSHKLSASIITDFHCCGDLVSVDVVSGDIPIVVLYFEEMVQKELLSKTLIEPLQSHDLTDPTVESLTGKLSLSAGVVPLDYAAALQRLSDGWVIVLIQGAPSIYGAELIYYDKRNISEPPTASVLKGPREGFVEDLKTNLSLIRRRLRTPELTVIYGKVGIHSRTSYAIVYLDGICDVDLVTAIKSKIDGISIDGVPDSSYIARLTESRPNSIFKQTGTTEKPDILMGKMLEGRLGVVVDGSPMVLTYPFVLLEDFQDSQDYFRKSARSTFLRLLRLFAMMLSILLPALYVAIQEFEYQMIPIKFLLTIINATDGIPLTPTLEMLLVIAIFEILNEAGVRMPRYVGMALSIVGAVVLGDTAVKAGLLSSPAVLISALSSTGIYCIPDQAGAFSLLRIAYVAIAGVLGLYGLLLALICTICYLAGMSSYGIPYLAPFAPLVPADIKDGFFKSDITDDTDRPRAFLQRKRKRKRV